MTREFIYFKTFDKNWHNLGLDDAELINLEHLIMDNPIIGKIIQGTGGLRKMRYPLPNRGKSESTRVLYVDYVSYEKTIIMNVYAKDEQATLTEQQKRDYKKYIRILQEELKK